MSRRIKIILAILIIVLILLALFLLWWNIWRPQPAPTTVVVVETEEEEVSSPFAIPPIAELDQRTDEEISVETLAKTFAERYGSYSNESNFANLDDLEPLMTDSLASELAVMVANTDISDMYYGITTQVVSMNIISIDETSGTASISVLTQREEAVGGPTNTEVSYETLVLDMVKVSGVWKVDGVTWQ